MGNHIWNEKCANERRIQQLEEAVCDMSELVDAMASYINYMIEQSVNDGRNHICDRDCATCDDCQTDFVPLDQCCCASTEKKAPTKVKIHKVRMCCH